MPADGVLKHILLLASLQHVNIHIIDCVLSWYQRTEKFWNTSTNITLPSIQEKFVSLPYSSSANLNILMDCDRYDEKITTDRIVGPAGKHEKKMMEVYKEVGL